MKTNLVVLALVALATSGCMTKKELIETVPTTTGNGAQSIPTNYAISVVAATTTQCSNGGSVYSVYLDSNSNSNLDSGETITNQQIVCNGSNGTNGYSTVFSVTRVSTGLLACASRSGLQVSSGLDTNRNNTLDNSEIIGTQVLCDGATGATGSAGAAGSNGYNMVFQTASAGSACSAGGTTIVMALDTNKNGKYDGTDSSQSSITLCNGTNGTNGTNAVLPAYTPVEPIMPCGNTVQYKEVLMRLANGQILASFSDNTAGDMTRLTLLPDGTYQDTDNSSCVFTLSTSSGGTTRNISWSGKVQESWAISY